MKGLIFVGMGLILTMYCELHFGSHDIPQSKWELICRIFSLMVGVIGVGYSFRAFEEHIIKWMDDVNDKLTRHIRPPENWEHIHHKNCGTKYRGCDPKNCPKDHFERTGEWRPELLKDLNKQKIQSAITSLKMVDPNSTSYPNSFRHYISKLEEFVD